MLSGNRKEGGYVDYFNYGLNTDQWRLFVNKQILMRYERLFIERQMNDVRNEENRLRNELADLDRQIAEVKRK
jgi:hypothetical protein